MTTAERLVAAYTDAWENRRATGDDAPEALRAELDRTLDHEGPPRAEGAAMVELFMRAWQRGTPPDKLWRPLLRSQVRATVGLVLSLYRLRPPKEFTLPRGLVTVDCARVDDDKGYVVVDLLPFRHEAVTQAALAWAWAIVHHGDEVADVPVWLDVGEGSATPTAVVMLGERVVGTTTVPEGTYEKLRGLTRRRRRCVPDGTLEFQRATDGRFVVHDLSIELP